METVLQTMRQCCLNRNQTKYSNTKKVKKSTGCYGVQFIPGTVQTIHDYNNIIKLPRTYQLCDVKAVRVIKTKTKAQQNDSWRWGGVLAGPILLNSSTPNAKLLVLKLLLYLDSLTYSGAII